MAEDKDLEVLGAALPVRSTTTDEQTDEGADGKVDEIPHRPIVPGDPSANRVSDPHAIRTALASCAILPTLHAPQVRACPPQSVPRGYPWAIASRRASEIST